MKKQENLTSSTLDQIQGSWDKMAKDDAMWAILTDPSKKNNQWDEESFFSTGRAFIDVQMKVFKNLKIEIKKENALDFGCGIGRLTQPLADIFDYVTGVDISKYMIQLARRYNQYPQTVTYTQNDYNLPFADKVFDYVQSHIVLQHIKAELTLNYIGEFLRVLKPKGILYFQLPVSFGNTSGICHFENKVQTSSGEVSMDMNCIPKKNILETIEKFGASCLYSEIIDCSDGMQSCTYIIEV